MRLSYRNKTLYVDYPDPDTGKRKRMRSPYQNEKETRQFLEKIQWETDIRKRPDDAARRVIALIQR